MIRSNGRVSTLNIGSGQTAYVLTGGMVLKALAMVMVEHIDKLGEEMINKPSCCTQCPYYECMMILKREKFFQGTSNLHQGHRARPLR